MVSLKKWFSSFQALAVLALLGSSVALAETPAPYTIDTKTGLNRTAERNLYQAVRAMVGPVARALGFTEAEENCAEADAGKALLEATRKALEGTMFGLPGADEAARYFDKQNNNWCDGQNGRRGAEAIAPYAARAQSIVRPFLRERLDELKALEVKVTPEMVAKTIGAGLAALAAGALLAPL